MISMQKVIKGILTSTGPLGNVISILDVSSTTKENFSTKSSGDGGVLAFFALVGVITYLVAMLVTWIRLVLKASTCGIGEGVAAFFVTSIYTMWKVGTLVGKDCNLSQNKGWGL